MMGRSVERMLLLSVGEMSIRKMQIIGQDNIWTLWIMGMVWVGGDNSVNLFAYSHYISKK